MKTKTRTDTHRLNWLCKNPRRVTHATGYGGSADGWTYAVCEARLRWSRGRVQDAPCRDQWGYGQYSIMKPTNQPQAVKTRGRCIMKITILFLTLICALLGTVPRDEVPQDGSYSYTMAANMIGFKPGPSEAEDIHFLTGMSLQNNRETMASITIGTAASETILRIGPMPKQEVPADKVPAMGAAQMSTIRYARPKKPEEITVELWTKDGKHYRAKWEEVK